MVIHNEIPLIFSSNLGFPLVKFTVSRHRERFEIPNTELIFDRNLALKNGNYRNTVKPYAPRCTYSLLIVLRNKPLLPSTKIGWS